MLCKKCNEKTATVNFTEVKEKRKTKIYLCADCAQNYQKYITSPSLSYSVSDLLGGLIHMVTKNKLDDGLKNCPECGTNYLDFQTKGRLGCPNDYKLFADKLDPLLLRIHGASKHIGKTPKTKPKTSSSISDLQKQMQQAISEEKYEEAAIIRDKLRKLGK